MTKLHNPKRTIPWACSDCS